MSNFSGGLDEHLLHVVEENEGCSKFKVTKEKMLRQFHLIRCRELKALWIEFSNSLALNNDDPLLSQFVFEEGFKRVIDLKFKSVEADITVEELTLEEHNALQYTAGYVPQCLI